MGIYWMFIHRHETLFVAIICDRLYNSLKTVWKIHKIGQSKNMLSISIASHHWEVNISYFFRAVAATASTCSFRPYVTFGAFLSASGTLGRIAIGHMWQWQWERQPQSQCQWQRNWHWHWHWYWHWLWSDSDCAYVTATETVTVTMTLRLIVTVIAIAIVTMTATHIKRRNKILQAAAKCRKHSSVKISNVFLMFDIESCDVVYKYIFCK